MQAKDQYCLESIIEVTDKILDYTSGLNWADEFDNNHLIFDATMTNFVVIEEMVMKLSDDFNDTHPDRE